MKTTNLLPFVALLASMMSIGATNIQTLSLSTEQSPVDN